MCSVGEAWTAEKAEEREKKETERNGRTGEAGRKEEGEMRRAAQRVVAYAVEWQRASVFVPILKRLPLVL